MSAFFAALPSETEDTKIPPALPWTIWIPNGKELFSMCNSRTFSCLQSEDGFCIIKRAYLSFVAQAFYKVWNRKIKDEGKREKGEEKWKKGEKNY